MTTPNICMDVEQLELEYTAYWNWKEINESGKEVESFFKKLNRHHLYDSASPFGDR